MNEVPLWSARLFYIHTFIDHFHAYLDLMFELLDHGVELVNTECLLEYTHLLHKVYL